MEEYTQNAHRENIHIERAYTRSVGITTVMFDVIRLSK